MAFATASLAIETTRGDQTHGGAEQSLTGVPSQAYCQPPFPLDLWVCHQWSKFEDSTKTLSDGKRLVHLINVQSTRIVVTALLTLRFKGNDWDKRKGRLWISSLLFAVLIHISIIPLFLIFSTWFMLALFDHLLLIKNVTLLPLKQFSHCSKRTQNLHILRISYKKLDISVDFICPTSFRGT